MDERARMAEELRAAMERDDQPSGNEAPSQPEKPLGDLTFKEVFVRICQCMPVQYSEHEELLERWWNFFPSKIQDEINMAAETFASSASYLTALYKKQRWVEDRSSAEAFFRDFERSLPRISYSLYEEIMSAVRSGEKVKRGKKCIPKAKLLVDRHVHCYTSAVREAFGLGQGRPRRSYETALTLSRWMYEGLTHYQAMHRWNEEHKDRPFKSAEAVKRKVSRFRDEHRDDRWYLRILIYSSAFPRIESLVCQTCRGTKKVWKPEWEAWRAWFSDPHRSGPEPEPGSPPPGTLPCPKCDGTGTRSF